MNNTVSKTVEILKLLSSVQEGMTLTQITHALSIPKSSVFDILQTLVLKELVEVSQEKDKTYRIGIGSFKIGYSYLNNTSADKVARPILADLNSATDETVYMALRSGSNDFIYIMKFKSNSEYQTVYSVGEVRHLLSAALGKAILAALSDDDALDCVTQEMYRKSSIPSIHDPASLITYLHSVRSDGYATDATSENSAFACPVAAPVLDIDGKVLGAISIVVMKDPTSESRIRELGKMVQHAALVISKRLGFLGNDLYRNTKTTA
jgi:DNA-binding IclR family transcriptional regulator